MSYDEMCFQVSELKRINNLVAEQDLFALPVVRIPISRLRKELDLEHERELLKNDSPVEDLDVNDTRDDRSLTFVLLSLLCHPSGTST